MNKYKKILIGLLIIITIVGSVSGYYIWCAYNPIINIQIGPGGTRKGNIKLEAPHIMIMSRANIDTAAAIELKLMHITTQHEFVMDVLQENYKEGDIKLELEVTDDQTILNYHGTAINNDNETVAYEYVVNFDFVLKANITKN